MIEKRDKNNDNDVIIGLDFVWYLFHYSFCTKHYFQANANFSPLRIYLQNNIWSEFCKKKKSYISVRKIL